jgi:spore maturation protein CgeB
MKILVAAWNRSSGDLPIAFSDALGSLGHEVRLVGLDSDLPPFLGMLHDNHKGSPWNRGALQRRLVNQWFLGMLREFVPELLFIWGSNWVLYPRTLNKVRELGVRIAIRESNLALFEPHQLQALELYDFFFTGESYIVPLLKRRFGVRSVNYLHGVADPRRFSPYEEPESVPDEWRADVSFFGSPYPNRSTFFKRLADAGVGFRLWGRGWEADTSLSGYCTPRSVGTVHKRRVYCGSKINLDLPAGHQQINAISSRAFEVLCCGGFALVEYRRDVERFFEIGREIDVFRTVDEAIEKIGYYLDHHDERVRIARNGRQRVLGDWTIEKMAARMVSIVEKEW